ncbi:Fe2+-dependent dioxygenase [Ahniella affigens]|uniref:Fe2+-dependent dioxygenase n=1 Tax=Ahniella affigens TaxID=2021234 RepID=A0A2P1PQ86_9GAMM|nr:Fe2+-dependent dioxygenase [Ahniella affigens]AVP97007.1 Fe2+-dependent dioxygenase [Ahniella affigens]
MLMVLDEVLDAATARQYRDALQAADWQDGRLSAGSLAKSVKSNQQLEPDHPVAAALGRQILSRLGQHPGFLSAALPERIYPPRFNRYELGGQFGLHVDSAVMVLPDSLQTLRSDLSATLFLTEPDEYDGGELEIETPFGAQAVKLAAGAMVLYPSSSLHRVRPVTTGARISSFFWIQSLVQDDAARGMLYDLDRSIQGLRQSLPAEHADLLTLTGVYHNLLRRWARP